MRSFVILIGFWLVLAILLSACGSSGSVSPTVSAAASQLAPTVSSAATLLAPTVEAAANQVAPTLSAAATQAAPTLSAAATQAGPTLSAAATQAAPTISAAATQIAPTLSAAATRAPTLAAAATQAVPTLSAVATQIAPTLSAGATQVASSAGKTYVLVPKTLGSPFYDAVNQGAQQAAKELGTAVTYLGNAAADTNQQTQLLGSILNKNISGLAVAGNSSDAYAAAARQAVSVGIPVVSWESPLLPGSGNLFASPAAPQSLAGMLVKMINDEAGATGGKVAVLSTSATAAYSNAWISALKTELQKPENAKLQLAATIYGNDEDAGSYAAVKDLLSKTPDLKVIVSGSPVASAAAARAVKDASMTGKVFVTGMGTPNMMRDFVKSGIATEFAAWNPNDLGYLAIYALDAISSGKMKGAAGDSFSAGRLNQFSVVSDPTFGPTVVLGTPTLVNKDNIEPLNY